jgi:glycerol uptake facilitator protein
MDNLLGEFFGTMVLVLFGDATVANALLGKSKGQNAGWVHITLGWGLAVLLGVLTSIALGAPQADINPAVTLCKMLNGVYSLPHAIATMGVQIVGGIAGGVLVYFMYLAHWAETPDAGLKLAVFSTGPAVRNTFCNFLTEFLATTILIFGIFVIFSKNVMGTAGFISGFGPFIVALLIIAMGMAHGGPTGYALNPARDLGPRVAHFFLPIPGKGSSDWGYAWIPVVAPLCGGAAAFAICKALGLL